MKSKVFYSRYFWEESHFEVGGTQNYLLIQPVYRYSKTIAHSNHISEWKSKALSDKGIKAPATSQW